MEILLTVKALGYGLLLATEMESVVEFNFSMKNFARCCFLISLICVPCIDHTGFWSCAAVFERESPVSGVIQNN